MSTRPKFGKTAIVIVLTLLVWVWADLSQDAEIDVSTVVITLAKGADPALWVDLVRGTEAPRAAVGLASVQLKGPASRIAEVDRLLKKGTLDLQLFLVPEAEGFTEPGRHTLNVLAFLKQSDKIRQYGLTVVSCEPKTIWVQVVRLVEKPLDIEAVDENGVPIKTQAIDPPRITARVPPDETPTAKVQLNRTEISLARVSAVEKTPFVVFANEVHPLSRAVKITLPAEGGLRDYTIERAGLGFCLSEVLQGKCRVTLKNPADMVTVRIKATPLAEQAYRQQLFHMELYINDDDIKKTGIVERPVVFNFPDEYVRKDEIVANQQPPVAKFEITLLPAPAGAESTGP